MTHRTSLFQGIVKHCLASCRIVVALQAKSLVHRDGQVGGIRRVGCMTTKASFFKGRMNILSPTHRIIMAFQAKFVGGREQYISVIGTVGTVAIKAASIFDGPVDVFLSGFTVVTIVAKLRDRLFQ